MKICQICGKEIKGRRTAYCSEECQKKGERQRQDERRQLDNGARKMNERKAVPKPKYTLAQIETMARSEGLTAGKFIAKYGL